MPHIICQILHGPERITIVWSQGKHCFEPYALAGAEKERFEQLAHQGRAQLAGGASAAELASTGHALHELLFQGNVGQEVRGWLEGQQDVRLEIVSNAPGRVPVSLLCSSAGDDVESFWGVRYGLTQGPRVGPLGLRPYIQDALVTVALDPVWEGPLSDEERRTVEMLAPRVCRSWAELQSALRAQAPDFLVVCARVEGEHVLLGPDRLRTADIARVLAETESGSLAPIAIMLADVKNAAAWSCFLAGAQRSFAGVLAFDAAMPAGVQIDAAAATLQRLVTQQMPLGPAMREVRAQLGTTGLGWSAYAPPHVRVVNEGDTLEPTGLRLYPLPAEPFHPLRPLDREERSLLVGRDHDIAALGRLVDQIETHGVLLHGPAGAGKASLLRAGLLPHLEEGPGYRVLRDRREGGPEDDMPTLALRPGLDPAAALAEALSSFAASPYSYTTPTGRAVTVDLPRILNDFISGSVSTSENIRDLTQASPGGAGASRPEGPATLWDAFMRRPEAVTDAWNALTASLPSELVVAIEHGEDLAALPEHAQRLISALTRVERGKVVLSLRSEFLGVLQDRMTQPERAAWRTYSLNELRTVDLRAILELPSLERAIPHASQVPATKYEVRFEPSATDAILSRAIDTANLRRMSPVTIVQVAASVLQRAVRGTIVQRDLRKLPFHSIATHYVETTAKRLGLPSPDRRALTPFLLALTAKGLGGAALEPLTPLSWSRSRWRGATPLESMLPTLAEPSVNLVQIHQAPIQGQTQAFVGLGHHALTALPDESVEQSEKRRYNSSKMVDALFVFIPLLLLACATTIFFMRRSAASDLKSLKTEADKEFKEIKAAHIDYQRRLNEMMAIASSARLTLAEQAIRRGDALDARQNLLAMQPTDDRFDDRSFEWFFLWKQVAPEKGRLEAQKEAVSALAASADGKVLASADAAGVLRLWNMKDRPEVGAELLGFKGRIHALAFAPGDKEIVAACDDGTLRLWSAKLGQLEPVRADKETRILGKHDGPARCLAFADANTLVSGGDDKKAIVWDVAAGKQQGELKAETPIRALAASADGKSFVAAAGKNAVFADLPTAQKSKDIAVNDAARIEALAFVGDNTLALGTTETSSGEEQGRLHLWDLKANKDSAAILDHGNGISSLAVWRDKGIVFTGGRDRVIRMWQAKDGKELRAIQGNLGEIRNLAVLSQAGLLASAAHDSAIKIIDLAPLLYPDTIAAHKGGVRSLAIAPEKNLVASGGKDGLVKFWLPTSAQPLGTLKLDAPVSALEFASHDKQLVLATGTWSAADKGEVKLWKIAISDDKVEATPWHTFTDVATGVRSLAFDLAGKRLAVVAANPAVWIVDVASGKRKGLLPVHREAPEPLVLARFDPNQREVVASNVTGGLIVWNAANENVEAVYSKVHGNAVRGIALPPFHGIPSICSVGDDLRFTRTLRDPASHNVLRKYEFRTNQFTHCLAAGADRVLVLGDETGIVTFYDLHFDRETLRIPAHEGPVRAVVVSPDQKLVVSAGDDGVIRLFRGDFPAKPPTPIKIAHEDEADE